MGSIAGKAYQWRFRTTGILGFEAVKRGRPKGKKTATPNARVNLLPGHRAHPATRVAR
jgi:hypothetical protein